MRKPNAPWWRSLPVPGSLVLASGLALLAGFGTATPAGAATGGDAPSKDEPQLVFGRAVDPDSPSALFTIHADGKGLRQISAQGGGPHWSPDGGRLVINPCDDPSHPSCPMVLNPDGHVLRTLSVPAIFRTAVTFWRPTIWSPDGRRLAGGAGSDDPSLSGVYTVNSSDGRGLQRVTSGEDNPGAYSPDGTRIEFIRSFADEEPTTAGLFVVESDGSGLTQITPDDLAVAREQDAGDWSPDGSRIVFTAQPAPGHRFALFTVAPDGTGLEQLPLPCGSAQDDPNGHGCFGGSYSADGTRLAYTARDASTGQTHIWIANSDGTDAHRLTTGETFDGQADWRP